MTQIPRNLFAESVEGSAALRVYALAVTLLAGGVLAYVGGDTVVWIGGSLVATAGHVFSWYQLRRRIALWPVLVLLPIVGISAMLALALPAAMRGDWLPILHYLVLFQSVASFHLRTRGGLYGTFLFCATVLVLASQLALDAGFLLLLGGYFVLLLSFLATATTRDAGLGALAYGAWARPGRVAAWTGWAFGVAGLGAILFLLLPWGTVRGEAAPVESVLPLRGEGLLPTGDTFPTQPGPPGGTPPAGDGTGLDSPGEPGGEEKQTPEATSQASPSDALPADNGMSQDATSDQDHQIATQPSLGDELLAEGGQGNVGAQGPKAVPIPQPAEEGPTAPLTTPGQDGAASPPLGGNVDDVVLQVRSPVVSYWRGQTYSTYDGRDWRPDTELALGRAPTGTARRYVQTFYVRSEQPWPLLGYSPMEWRLLDGSDSGDALQPGTVYQAVSYGPTFDPTAVRGAASGIGPRATSLSAIDPRVRALAEELVGRTASPLERALLIAGYLRNRYSYVPSEEGAGGLRPSEMFLFNGERSGTGFDFASAHALLSRGAGLEARLVTGYLPGELDPLTGTHVVRRRDAHAWSEVYIPSLGWVPFDASPRGDLPGGDLRRGGSTGALAQAFELRLGDDLRRGLQTAIASVREQAGGLLLAPCLAAIAVLVGGAAAFRLRSRRHSSKATWRYSQLQGEERRGILAAYHRLEGLLRARGMSPREPSETLASYFDRVKRMVPNLDSELEWLRGTVTEAAYGPAGPAQGQATQARGWLLSIKPVLKRHGARVQV